MTCETGHWLQVNALSSMAWRTFRCRRPHHRSMNHDGISSVEHSTHRILLGGELTHERAHAPLADDPTRRTPRGSPRGFHTSLLEDFQGFHHFDVLLCFIPLTPLATIRSNGAGPEGMNGLCVILRSCKGDL
jgi:hypothetical protein